MLASHGGHSEVVQNLLLAGVNKDAADNVGCRATLVVVVLATLGAYALLCVPVSQLTSWDANLMVVSFCCRMVGRL